MRQIGQEGLGGGAWVWGKSRLTSGSDIEHDSKACRNHSLRTRRVETQVLVSLYPCVALRVQP